MRERHYAIFNDDVYAIIEQGFRDLNPLRLHVDAETTDIEIHLTIVRKFFGPNDLILNVTVREHDKDPDPPVSEPKRPWYTRLWMSPREA